MCQRVGGAASQALTFRRLELVSAIAKSTLPDRVVSFLDHVAFIA